VSIQNDLRLTVNKGSALTSHRLPPPVARDHCQLLNTKYLHFGRTYSQRTGSVFWYIHFTT